MPSDLTIRRRLRAIRGRIWMIGVVTIAAAALAFVISGLLPKTFEARATVLVGPALVADNLNYDQLVAPQRLITTYAQLVTGRPMAARVITRLGLPMTPDQLANKLRAEASLESLFITVTAEDRNPSLAAQIANAAALELVEASPDITVGETTTKLLSVSESAVVPDSPSAPRTLSNTALAALIGLLLSISLVYAIDYLDRSIKSEGEAEGATGLPSLGAIGRIPGAVGPNGFRGPADEPGSPITESFRALRLNVEFAGVDVPVHCLLVTSPHGGDGRTTVAANLALAFAQAGRRTLLVDADLRNPALHRYFGLPNGGGLTTLMDGDSSSPASQQQAGSHPNLSIITAGPVPKVPAEALGSLRINSVIERMKADAEVIVVDSPAVDWATDAAILAEAVDAVILVLREGVTTGDDARHTRDVVGRVTARMLGTVLNAAPKPERRLLARRARVSEQFTPHRETS